MNKEKIFDALFWFFMILGFALLAWKIFGDSPLTEQIFIAFIVGFLLKIYTETGTNSKNMAKLEGKFESELANIKDSLKKLENKLGG